MSAKIKDVAPVKKIPLTIEALAVRRRDKEIELVLTFGGLEVVLLSIEPEPGVDFTYTVNAQAIWDILRE